MNKYTSHITINGKCLCVSHEYLLGDRTPDGNRITCDYAMAKGAKAVAKHLRYRFPTSNVRIKGGPCPIHGD